MQNGSLQNCWCAGTHYKNWCLDSKFMKYCLMLFLQTPFREIILATFSSDLIFMFGLLRFQWEGLSEEHGGAIQESHVWQMLPRQNTHSWVSGEMSWWESFNVCVRARMCNLIQKENQFCSSLNIIPFRTLYILLSLCLSILQWFDWMDRIRAHTSR